MMHDRPLLRMGVLAGGVVCVVAVATAVATAKGQHGRRLTRITMNLTTPAVGVPAGRAFAVNVSCQDTSHKTPCRTRIRILDEHGIVFKQFDDRIDEGGTKSYSVEPGSQPPDLKLLRAIIVVDWLALKQAQEPCCCDPNVAEDDEPCESQPVTVQVYNSDTGQIEIVEGMTVCAKVRKFGTGGGT